MKLLGAHLSISKGLHTLQKQMELLNCEVCALFLKNQRRFEASALIDETIKKFKKAVKNPERLLPHGSYLINLANPETMEKSYKCFLDDLKRCEALGITLYNLHPGSDVQKLGEKALKMIASQINRAHKEVSNVIILLENMAGQGNCLGRTFEELACIIENVEKKERVGITLDTAHMFAAGYDIRTSASFEKVMADFDKVVGKKYLKAMHLNDSKSGLGSRRDLHEELGKGCIGLEAFRYIMNSNYFEDIPMVLETPNPERFKETIEILKSFED